MKNRAFSVLTIKSVDDEQRIIRGIASTPVTDRSGDIIRVEGVKFEKEAAFLLYHDTKLPVGKVTFTKNKNNSLDFEANIPFVTEQGIVKDRVDEAWHSVKYRLLTAVSIGFIPVKYNYMENGGIEFVESEVFELSLVAIPANPEATITQIKSIDDGYRAALRDQTASGTVPVKPAGDTAKKSVSILKKSPVEGNKMNISEQLKNFLDSLGIKKARQAEIMGKSATEGRTLDASESEEFDTLDAEIKSIEDHVARLKSMESVAAASATPVIATTVKSVTDGTNARTAPVIRAVNKQAPGVALAQVARCLGISKGNANGAVDIAKSMYPNDRRIENILKAAVTAGSTTSGSWAENLVSDESAVFADFVEFLRPQTILGKFGVDGVPALRNVPFNTPLVGQTDGGEAYWTGECKPKGLTGFDFSRTTLPELKVATIAVVTDELLRRSSPSADMLIRDSLAGAIRGRLDTDFINPSKAASAGISPASITNGVTPTASSGDDADAVRADIRALMQTFINNNISPASGVFIMSTLTALSLSLMTTITGTKEFPGMTMNGGILEGLPCIVSEYVPTVSAGSYVVLVNANDIWLGDEGGIMIDVSREASLEMLDSGFTQNALNGTGSSLVSLWQNNLMGFRAERMINWAKRRSAAVAVLSEVTWGAPA